MRNAISISSASATIRQDDDGRPYTVANLVIGGHDVEVVIHQSLVYANTINVEINGDFTTAGLRLNVNDGLAFDSTLGTAPLPDHREPDAAEEIHHG